MFEPSAPLSLQWYTLNDVKSGRVHLVLEWLPRVSDLSRLEQVAHRRPSLLFPPRAAEVMSDRTREKRLMESLRALKSLVVWQSPF